MREGRLCPGGRCMSLKAAVRAIERKVGRHGRCGVCDGRGSYDTVLVRGGVQDRPPRPCRGCGEIACVTRIVLEEE